MTEDGIKSTEIAMDPKKKFGKDVLLPKKPMSAYLLFSQQNCTAIKEKEKLEKHTDAMKRCGEIWSGMSDKEKKKYNDLHLKDAERYKKQLKELENKGFFKMEDGSKSSDHVKKEKKRKREEESEEESEEEEPPKKRSKK